MIECNFGLVLFYSEGLESQQNRQQCTEPSNLFVVSALGHSGDIVVV